MINLRCCFAYGVLPQFSYYNLRLDVQRKENIIIVLLFHVDYMDYPTSKGIPPKFWKKFKQAYNFGTVLIKTPVQS